MTETEMARAETARVIERKDVAAPVQPIFCSVEAATAIIARCHQGGEERPADSRRRAEPVRLRQLAAAGEVDAG